MLNVGLLIAGALLVIYLVLGPLVLMATHAFFDSLAERAGDIGPDRNPSFDDKDPALWTDRDVRRYMKRKF